MSDVKITNTKALSKHLFEAIKVLRDEDPILEDVQKTQKFNETNFPLSKLYMYQIKRNNYKVEKRLFDSFRIICCLMKHKERYKKKKLSKHCIRHVVRNLKNLEQLEHISFYQNTFMLLFYKNYLTTYPFKSKQLRRKNSWSCFICEYILSDIIDFCDGLPVVRNFIPSDYTISKSYQKRKLLQTYSSDDRLDNKEWTEIDFVQTWISGEDNHSKMDNTTYNGLSLARWKEFLTTINQTLSRDHIWAMLSLVSLVVLMMLAMKVCGLKPMDRRHEKHMDYVFRDFDHTVSIKEIIALKKPYLPKRVLQFTNRWKWKRKKTRIAIRERDIVDNISDNSNDERLIYSKPINDF